MLDSLATDTKIVNCTNPTDIISGGDNNHGGGSTVRTTSSNKGLIIFSLLGIIAVIGGMACFIMMAVRKSNLREMYDTTSGQIVHYVRTAGVGDKQEDEQVKGKENGEEIDDTNDPEELKVEEVPLKNCDNSDNALFIVDESQLISDHRPKKIIDLVFGSGCLLKDFLKFTCCLNSKRKIIFIGDPFQLQSDESPLNPLYLEKAYKLKTNAYQLLDNPDFSVVNKEALFCVDKIRTKYFNSLQFFSDEKFCILQKDDITKVVFNIIHNKADCHILCFSNEKSQEVNFWIKKIIRSFG